MDKTKCRNLNIAVIIVSIFASIIIITAAIVAAGRRDKPKAFILKSYGNNVALYSGDEIVEVYGSVLLDTLPESDKKMLDTGISFPTKEEAVSAIEDYDG